MNLSQLLQSLSDSERDFIAGLDYGADRETHWKALDTVITLRTSGEIARRSLALYSVVAATHGVSKTDLAQWLKEEGLSEELTPRETRFLAQSEPPEKEKIWMTWFAEAEFKSLHSTPR